MKVISANERCYTALCMCCCVCVGCRGCCSQYLNIFFWRATEKISFCLNPETVALSLHGYLFHLMGNVNPRIWYCVYLCISPEKIQSPALWPSSSNWRLCILTVNQILHLSFLPSFLNYFKLRFFFWYGFCQLLYFFFHSKAKYQQATFLNSIKWYISTLHPPFSVSRLAHFPTLL